MEKTKELIECVPDKLESIEDKNNLLYLRAGSKISEVDLVIDCTGRENELSDKLTKQNYNFVKGDIELYGGKWDEELDRFIASQGNYCQKKLPVN